jgi:hypothetical protein
VEPYLQPNRLVDFVKYDIRGNGFFDKVAVAHHCEF